MDAPEKAHKPRCPCCGLDAHAHWFPPEWMDLLEREGPRHGVVLEQNKHGYRTAEGGGLPFRQTFAPDMIDLSCVVDSMAAARLDLRILSLTNPMVFWAPDGLGLELARTFNDACGEAIRKHPSKIRGAITLPLQSPALALKELERAADIPGMCCAYSAMHINGINIDHKSFWPIYEFCQDRKLPICRIRWRPAAAPIVSLTITCGTSSEIRMNPPLALPVSSSAACSTPFPACRS
jgi:predicted TIM-barrel fold metal-dependent hydrolase